MPHYAREEMNQVADITVVAMIAISLFLVVLASAARREFLGRDGKLVGFKGAGVAEVIKTVGDDPTARIIGEFGIGTNRGARICPNMLEAEKAFGTVHFAIGDSYGIGKNKSKFHFDALVDKVTLRANGRLIAKDGKFLI